MKTWGGWIRRKLAAYALRPDGDAPDRVGPAVDLPERSPPPRPAIHPDDAYWPADPQPAEQAPAEAATDFGRSLHPDDAYWPAPPEPDRPTPMPEDDTPTDGMVAFASGDLDTFDDGEEEEARRVFDLAETTAPDVEDGLPFGDPGLLASSPDASIDLPEPDRPSPIQDDERTPPAYRMDAFVPDDLDAFDDGEEEDARSLFDLAEASTPDTEDGLSDDELSFADPIPLDIPPDTSANLPDDDLDWLYDVEDDPTQPASPFAPPEADIPAWRVSERAALLVERLGPGSVARRDAAFDIFRTLLEEFPHGGSARAIAERIDDGMTLEDLIRCATLKRLWRDDRSLWLRRDYRNGTRICPSQRLALTWVGAGRLVADKPPGAIIDPMLGEWRTAWMDMPPPDPGERASPAWFSYAAFLDDGPPDWAADFAAFFGEDHATGRGYAR